MTLSYHFSTPHLPTQANLIKHAKKRDFLLAKTPQKADLNDSHLLLNDDALTHLEYKHFLHELITRHHPTLVPKGYSINDHNTLDIATAIQDQTHRQWILKPALRNNGDGIKLIADSQALIEHYQSTKRYGGDHLLQEYLTQPHLLNGHKYSLRLFIVMTHEAKASLYPQGYMNIAKHAYDNGSSDLSAHLTNEYLDPDKSSVWQVPTERCPHFDVIYQKIKVASHHLMSAFFSEHADDIKQTQPAINFLGVDWMLDESLKLWLLEVNHGPCFPTDNHHPLQTHLYHDFWESVMNEFICPMVSGNSPEKGTEIFERL